MDIKNFLEKKINRCDEICRNCSQSEVDTAEYGTSVKVMIDLLREFNDEQLLKLQTLSCSLSKDSLFFVEKFADNVSDRKSEQLARDFSFWGQVEKISIRVLTERFVDAVSKKSDVVRYVNFAELRIHLSKLNSADELAFFKNLQEIVDNAFYKYENTIDGKATAEVVEDFKKRWSFWKKVQLETIK